MHRRLGAGSGGAEEVEAAKAKLAGLQHEFEVLAEQYNDAKYRLALIERKLAEARDQRDIAEQQAQRAESRLATRAVQAYVGTGSQVDGLLGAWNIMVKGTLGVLSSLLLATPLLVALAIILVLVGSRSQATFAVPSPLANSDPTKRHRGTKALRATSIDTHAPRRCRCCDPEEWETT